VHWLTRLFRKNQSENQLDAELRDHLERQISDYIAAGISPEESRRRARLDFGGLESIKQQTRESRRGNVLESLFQDLRYAIRNLRKDRRFAFVAIFALALGIGASTIVFSIGYNVFFNALPYKDFNRLVVIGIRSLAAAGGGKVRSSFSLAEIRALREQNHVFEELVGHMGMRPTYDDGKSIRYFSFGAVVTANTFDYLGVPPLLGRTISQEDGSPGAPPVFVMNYRLWQREFGGDPKILGTTFILNGKPTTLIGIMPLKFNAFGANFWVPATPDYGRLQLMGRLKAGVSGRTAGADLDAIAHRLHKPNPAGIFPEDKFAIVPVTLLDSLIGSFDKILYALLAAVLLLLLIACTNVANLLLARATAREREIALRATLGATRGRLISQLLVESFLLAVAATGAGCLLAYFGLKAVVALIPAGTLPEETVINMHMNAPVLFLSLGLTILTTILCGLAPAFHAVRGCLQSHLASAAKGTGGSSRLGKLRSGLVVGEVALSIVLLIGAGLLMRSFLILTRVDLGFDPKNVLYFELNLPPSYNTDIAGTLQRKNALTRQLLERLRALPGVISVAEMADDPPPLQYQSSDTIIPGKPHTELWETRIEMCSDGYFQTLGLPSLRGRFFSEDDVTSARDVMVVNEAFSRQYFPNEDPLGHKVKLDIFDKPYFAAAAPHDTYFEIIGIVRDSKTRGYDNPSWQSFPQAFVPYSVAGFNWRVFMARTSVDPSSLLKNMGQEVHALDPGVQISTSGTLEGALQEFYRGPQFELVVLAAFASIGLALVVIGIFSVMDYTVSLRTQEFGVRIALGAQQENILKMVLVKGTRLLVVGILLGLSASYGLTRFLASQIWGVSTRDPWTFSAVAGLVVAVGLAACFLPARRATRVDPLVALRYE
jgi:putative ABC transport system permease protein